LKVIEGAIEKVRESVKFVRGSSGRKRKFAECIAQLSLKCGRHVRQDIVTRWNYTYLMLDCALVYERAYARLKLVDSSYKTCPTEEEWARIRAITKILKPFYDITTLFSGTSYPTSNLYFHNVWKIQLHIQEATASWDPVISGMAKEMKTKFEKYWDTYSMILSFAVILDPRYKMKIIEYCFDKLGMVGEMLSDKVGSIESGLRKLYNGYQVRADAIHDLNLATSQNVAVENPSDYLDGFESFRSRYDNLLKEKSQLDKYLEEPPLDRFQHPNLNILQYWKENQRRYPELAQMAHDILSIPILEGESREVFMKD
ncbi:zinc finger BED domain-containing protein RICESLEEPER 2-like protein, partial [Tanacetum coccineum]